MFTGQLGRITAWLLPLMVAATLVVVVLRYVFSEGTLLLQESVLYLHAFVFMLGIPYALKEDAHVRVDLIYSRLGRRGRATIDLLGHVLFLIPVASAMIVFSTDYVAASWRIREGSSEVGGIPGIFVLKTLIPVTAALLLLQGVAETVRCIRALRQAHGPDVG